SFLLYPLFCLFSFFFNDPATTSIYTLSLHDALPIFSGPDTSNSALEPGCTRQAARLGNSRANSASPSERSASARRLVWARTSGRSEEHTSELQSRGHLVCRLLLEKKKQKKKIRTNN